MIPKLATVSRMEGGKKPPSKGKTRERDSGAIKMCPPLPANVPIVNRIKGARKLEGSSDRAETVARGEGADDERYVERLCGLRGRLSRDSVRIEEDNGERAWGMERGARRRERS